ncbi:MAG: GntR family transcriptional regulator [Pseudohongiellaceae bacterium]
MTTPTSLTYEIAAVLRTEILRGQYRPGERLPSERDLAVRFHSSRGVVREALTNLAQLGIIDIQPGGVRIVPRERAHLSILGHLMKLDNPPDPQLVDQFLQIFGALSVLTTRSAIQKASPDQLTQARELVAELDRQANSFDGMHRAWRELLEFFKSIDKNLVLQLIGNDLKAQFVDQILTLGIKPDLDETVHNMLVKDLDEALRLGDAQQAADAIQDYSDHMRVFVVSAVTARQQRKVDS